MAILIGIGSWADDAYEGVLYPPELPAKQRLSGYARRFNHVEVNSTYYSTPRASLTAQWVEQTPAGFTFNIKLHRAFSQSPAKTAATGNLTKLLLEGVQPLIEAKRLGVFFLVLPPTFGPERHQLEELDGLASALQPQVLAVELRHREWVQEKRRASTLGYFKERRIAWISVDMPRLDDPSLMPPGDEVTRTDLAYLRLHGRNPRYLEANSAAERHQYLYSAPELKEIVRRVRAMERQAQQVHVIANNHATDFALRTALALQEMLASNLDSVPGNRDESPASARSPKPISSSVNSNQKSNMAKSQNSKKETKKAPQKTAKEKKQAKRDKKG